MDARAPGKIRYDADAECGQTTGSSSLDAQKYVGWNESVLCCQLTDPADTDFGTNARGQVRVPLGAKNFFLLVRGTVHSS
nr:hypothetical protein BaRGS_021131 [Batillaria attramentaria]